MSDQVVIAKAQVVALLRQEFGVRVEPVEHRVGEEHPATVLDHVERKLAAAHRLFDEAHAVKFFTTETHVRSLCLCASVVQNPNLLLAWWCD
jgi:hypothetical protein